MKDLFDGLRKYSKEIIGQLLNMDCNEIDYEQIQNRISHAEIRLKTIRNILDSKKCEQIDP